MAVASQRRTTILSKSNVGFIIDATVSEEHAISVTTTEHPVEKGFAITDHRRVQPSVLKLSGVVSNYPVKLFASAGGAKNYVVAAWDAFNTLKDSGELVSITTSLKTYENMMISDVSVPRDKDKANSLHFSVTAKELRIVESETVDSPKIEAAPTPEPKPKAQSVGTKTPAPPDEPLQSGIASLLGP